VYVIPPANQQSQSYIGVKYETSEICEINKTRPHKKATPTKVSPSKVNILNPGDERQFKFRNP
jgi:hypothetical protein